MAEEKKVNSIFAHTVRSAVKSGALSHAVILSGEGDKRAAGRYLAAAYLCEEADAPCLRCTVCRKVWENIHPDVITVEELEKKELAIDEIRQVRASVYIRPNEGKRKVYLFPNCAQLNEKDQNVLLKIVEEGPAYSAFIFCTESAGSLLPTVRSRCTEIKLRQEEDLPDGEKAAALFRCVGKREDAARYFTGLEVKRLKREEAKDLLENAWVCASQVLLYRAGKSIDPSYTPAVSALEHVSDRALHRLIETLRRHLDECKYNIGPGHLFGALLAELTEEEFL